MKLAETYSAVVQKLRGQILVAKINEVINVDRLKTMYFDHWGDREIELRFIDPRRFRPSQRNFIFAMIGDIFLFTGQHPDDLKDYFYLKFEAVTGRPISLSDDSETTVSDASLLADIIIDFIFDWDIPFKEGYEILPVNQEYFFYKCLANRKCCICGNPADIHHAYGVVGMGNDRKKFDHRNSKFEALCRTHHSEAHPLGQKNFDNKYQIKAIHLNLETLKRLGIQKADIT